MKIEIAGLGTTHKAFNAEGSPNRSINSQRVPITPVVLAQGRVSKG